MLCPKLQPHLTCLAAAFAALAAASPAAAAPAATAGGTCSLLSSPRLLLALLLLALLLTLVLLALALLGVLPWVGASWVGAGVPGPALLLAAALLPAVASEQPLLVVSKLWCNSWCPGRLHQLLTDVSCVPLLRPGSTALLQLLKCLLLPCSTAVDQVVAWLMVACDDTARSGARSGADTPGTLNCWWNLSELLLNASFACREKSLVLILLKLAGTVCWQGCPLWGSC